MGVKMPLYRLLGLLCFAWLVAFSAIRPALAAYVQPQVAVKQTPAQEQDHAKCVEPTFLHAYTVQAPTVSILPAPVLIDWMREHLVLGVQPSPSCTMPEGQGSPLYSLAYRQALFTAYIAANAP